MKVKTLFNKLEKEAKKFISDYFINNQISLAIKYIQVDSLEKTEKGDIIIKIYVETSKDRQFIFFIHKAHDMITVKEITPK